MYRVNKVVSGWRGSIINENEFRRLGVVVIEVEVGKMVFLKIVCWLEKKWVFLRSFNCVEREILDKYFLK